MKSKLTRLATKIKHFHDRIYCGYLTPSETVYLYENKLVQGRHEDCWNLDWAIRSKAAGISNPSWSYFQLIPNTELTEIMVRKHD